jgi:hypothetical protein
MHSGDGAVAGGVDSGDLVIARGGEGSVVVVEYSRKTVVKVLRRTGYAGLAEEAMRVLPDPVDLDELERWSGLHGITVDQLINRMGGSP